MEIKIDKKSMAMEYETSRMAETVFKHYGLELQLVKLLEESGELIQAIAKCLLNRTPQDIANKTLPDDVVEELADAFLLMKQVIFFSGLGEQIRKTQNEKLKRQIERIKAEKEDIEDGKENKD